MLGYCCLRLCRVWTEICSCVGVAAVVRLAGGVCSGSCSEGMPTANCGTTPHHADAFERHKRKDLSIYSSSDLKCVQTFRARNSCGAPFDALKA